MRKELIISVIMPVRNGELTMEKTLESLLDQSKKFDELIIVDDASSDESVKRVKKFLGEKKEYKLIKNEKQRGLAATYNRGIKAAKGDLVVTLHQDIILERDALEKLIVPLEDNRVAATSHVVAHPLEVWNKYNFWQKCAFARLAGKDFSGIDGKFDCFRKSALEKVGLFDEVHFRTAGEDGDIVYKLREIGKVINTKARIIHLHRVDPKFSWKDVVHKQKQYSEAQGALLARGRICDVFSLGKSFFREILLILLIIPYLKIPAVLLILLYSFYYTKLVYLKEYRDGRVITLPFLNVFLLFVSFVYSLKGFVSGRQKI